MRVRLDPVGRGHEHHELGAFQGLPVVVPGVADRREAFEVAAGGDPARLGDRDDVRPELGRRAQRHLVAVLREVERRRDATVARSQNRDPHPEPP